jgi:hypothetical protein
MTKKKFQAVEDFVDYIIDDLKHIDSDEMTTFERNLLRRAAYLKLQLRHPSSDED